MKFRTGFVSNSSSSSFICLLPVDSYNLILNKLSTEDQVIIQSFTENKSLSGVSFTFTCWNTQDLEDLYTELWKTDRVLRKFFIEARSHGICHQENF